VFDLDDTLYLERDYSFSGFDHIEKTFSFPGFADEARRLFLHGVRGTIFDDVLTTLGIPIGEDLVPRLVKVFRGHVPNIALLPDAIWAIEWAKQSFSLGLITDGYLVGQEAKIDSLGLRCYFDAVIVSDRWGRLAWKPSPRPYCEVEKALQLSGEECVYVGDNPKKDFVTAKQRGWTSVRIRRKEGEHFDVEVSEEYEAGYTISDLYQLPAVLGFNETC